MSFCLNGSRHLARVVPVVLPCILNNCLRGVSKKLNMPFYAVAKGVVPGIYTEWSECQKQTQGFKGPQFKKFATREEAEDFISQKVGNTVDKRKPAEAAASDDASSNGAAKKKKTEDGAAVSAGASKEKASKEKAPKSSSADKGKKRERSPDSKSSSADKGKKRERSPDSASSAAGEKQEAKSYESVIRKKVMEREVPDKEKFEVDESGSVVVYTDGCCEFNGRHGAKAGVGVYFGLNNPLNISEPVRGRATNNTAEIQAITYALELIKRAGFTKAVINTDSQFVISCMTSWLSGWKKKGWKKSDGSTVINKEDLMDLDRASDGLMVKYNHVKGHSGLEGNEKADELAKAGAKHYDANIKE